MRSFSVAILLDPSASHCLPPEARATVGIGCLASYDETEGDVLVKDECSGVGESAAPRQAKKCSTEASMTVEGDAIARRRRSSEGDGGAEGVNWEKYDAAELSKGMGVSSVILGGDGVGARLSSGVLAASGLRVRTDTSVSNVVTTGAISANEVNAP